MLYEQVKLQIDVEKQKANMCHNVIYVCNYYKNDKPKFLDKDFGGC